MSTGREVTLAPSVGIDCSGRDNLQRGAVMDLPVLIEHMRKRTTLLVTYTLKACNQGRPVVQGCGTFIKAFGMHMVSTCTHVLEEFEALYRAGLPRSVQVSTGYGCTGLECHAGYVLGTRETLTVQGVESRYGHRDTGVILLREEDVPEVRRSKAFIQEPELVFDLPSKRDRLFTWGFPNLPETYDGNLRAAYPEPLFRSGRVVGVDARILILGDCTLDITSAIPGCQTRNVPLGGTSGSGVFDYEGRLVGIYWGHDGEGENTRYFVCPVNALRQLIKEYQSTHTGPPKSAPNQTIGGMP